MLCATLAKATAARDRADLIAALTAAGVPAGPINRVSEALSDPQAQARGRGRPQSGDRSLTHMYTLVPFIRGQELVAVDAAGEKWRARVPALIEQELGQ